MKKLNKFREFKVHLSSGTYFIYKTEKAMSTAECMELLWPKSGSVCTFDQRYTIPMQAVCLIEGVKEK